MTYETIDWELEVKRIALAFAVEEPCAFFEKTKKGVSWRELLLVEEQRTCITHTGYDLTVLYGPTGRSFNIVLSDTRWRRAR